MSGNAKMSNSKGQLAPEKKSPVSEYDNFGFG
jgi:hypothetical protein